MKKGILFSVFFAFLILTVSLSAFAASEAKAEDLPISHGIHILAEKSSMAMAQSGGKSILFDEDDFARALNLSSISGITITEVPNITDGELLLGSTVISAGTTVSAKNLGYLKYDHRSHNTTTASFRFKVNDASYDMKCSLYLIDSVNHAPTLSIATETALEVSTHKNIMLYGVLPSYDPDGDCTKIEIVSYPKNGSILLTDREKGEYTYLPNKNYSGSDSFSYVAVDVYGNYSSSKTVSLEITLPKTSVVYADMLDSPMYNSALTVTENGIMSGVTVGEISCFYPQKTVTRAEFVVMAMKAVGIREVAAGSEMPFCDGEEISPEFKDYIKTAYELGYINGREEQGKLCFFPNQAITRAEAAVIVCSMIDAATPTVTPVFEDSKDIPSFAVSSVNSLVYMGLLKPTNQNISASEPMTRSDAAYLLSCITSLAK